MVKTKKVCLVHKKDREEKKKKKKKPLCNQNLRRF